MGFNLAFKGLISYMRLSSTLIVETRLKKFFGGCHFCNVRESKSVFYQHGVKRFIHFLIQFFTPLSMHSLQILKQSRRLHDLHYNGKLSKDIRQSAVIYIRKRFITNAKESSLRKQKNCLIPIRLNG